MTVSSLFLVCMFSLVGAKFNCATPADFKANNSDLHNSGFKFQEKKKALPLHEFLFLNGPLLGRGTFGEVKAAAGYESKLVIKKVESSKPEVLEAMSREIGILKELCGKKKKDIDKKLFVCDFKAIAGFKGCVEDGNSIYVFQEPMTMDLKSFSTSGLYTRLSGKEKALMMLQIIKKFQQIHDKKIVHSDIKPANIMMKTNDLSDLRIVDFGSAGKNGDKSVGGSGYYLAPERHVQPVLSYSGDVYSLAISFAMLEEAGNKGIVGMDDSCFEGYPDDDCRNHLQLVLKKAFSKETNTDFLLEVFLTATSYDPALRYSSMKKFAEAIAAAAGIASTTGGNPAEKPKGKSQAGQGTKAVSIQKASNIGSKNVGAKKKQILII